MLDRSTGYSILKSLREGQSFQQQGGGKFVHVDDVAAATVAAVERDEANGRAFNLVDCYARWADWAKIAAEVLGMDAKIDVSSPEAPQNQFDVTAARSLGVGLNRGVKGIRKHLKELAGKMGLQRA
jgi:nucleoside-diphosphate-sugar epimerase